MKSMLFTMAFVAISLGSAVAAAPVDNSAMRLASLEVGARVSPSDGGAYAELASAYWRAGRTADAVTAYRRVLALDNVMLETPTGEAIWSHAVARVMLGKALQTTANR